MNGYFRGGNGSSSFLNHGPISNHIDFPLPPTVPMIAGAICGGWPAVSNPFRLGRGKHVQGRTYSCSFQQPHLLIYFQLQPSEKTQKSRRDSVGTAGASFRSEGFGTSCRQARFIDDHFDGPVIILLRRSFARRLLCF